MMKNIFFYILSLFVSFNSLFFFSTGDDGGYYYTHLGAGSSTEDLRSTLSERFISPILTD